MTPVELGQMDRTMKGLTIGRVQGQNARKVQDELEGLLEREDQFKVEISGRAGEFPVWQEVHLVFNVEFIDPSGQRETDFERPFMTYGSYIERGGPVGVLATVTRWDVGKKNQTTGCMLAISAVSTDHARKFRGEVHVRFQGFGAPTEAYGDPSLYDVD